MKTIEKIITLYFGKNFSLKSRFDFARWFLSDTDRKVKDHVMEQFWEKDADAFNADQTEKEWGRLRTRIENEKTIGGVKRSIRVRRLLQYAAVISMFSISVYLAYDIGEKQMYAHYKGIQYIEQFASHGECKQMTLPDGTVVWLNAGSVLIYPEMFDQQNRLVYLSGEAHFDVAKNPAMPFVVETKTVGVEALGTVFNVESYPGADKTSVTLEEGSVRVDFLSTKEESRVMAPNDRLVYNTNSRQYNVTQVDAHEYSSWKEGYLVFKEANFSYIIASMERRFNVSIYYPSEDRFSGLSLFYRIGPNETIDESMKILSRLGNFNYSIKGKDILIY